jgi:regulator of protease activity HflC (stomatin/prohibitin superfamily)
MLSRIFWIGIAGIALIAGMALQDGDGIFSWGDHRTDISAKTEQAIAASVDRAVEGSVDKMEITGSDGEEIDVPPETKRALAEAVGRLVKAETALAMVRVREASTEERQEAEARRAQARADVDRLKAEIKRIDQSAKLENEAISDEVKREIREDIRAEVRDAVGN